MAPPLSRRRLPPYNERWPIEMKDIPQIEVQGTQNFVAFPSEDPIRGFWPLATHG